jgi:hypothetical protein
VILSVDETEQPLLPDAHGAGGAQDKGAHMSDLVAVALSVAFFVLAAAFVYFCDKVR